MGVNLKSIFKITIKHNFFASSAEIEAPLAVVALELKYFISLGKLIFFPLNLPKILMLYLLVSVQ